MKNLDQPPAQHPAAAQLSNLKDELNVASRIARRAQADVDIQKASVRVMQKTNAEILLRLTAFEKAARFLPKRPPQPRRPFSATEMTIEGSPSQNSDPVPMFESSSPSPISSPHCDFGPPLDGDSEDEGAGPIRISASTQLMSTPLHELENLPLYASPNVGRSAPVVRAQLTHHPPAAQYARPHSTAQGSPVGYITVPESDTLACEEPSSIAVDIPALSSRSPSSFPVGSNPLLPSADPQDKHQSFPSLPPCNEHRSIRNSFSVVTVPVRPNSIESMADSLTPELLIESPSRLTAYKDWEVDKPYQAWDGIVGAVIPGRRQFITSPNAPELFSPPEQTSHVILRQDGRWGPDDPFQCPQLYQQQYCHHACVLKRIDDPFDPRSIMWWTPKEADLSADPIVPQRYSVKFVHLTSFKLCVSRLVEEFSKDKDSLRTEANSQWVNMLVNQLQIWVNRLSTFATIFPNVLFLVAEVQRRWLDLRAYIDYMVLVKKELSKLRPLSTKFPPCHPFIGAITYNLTVAEEFAQTGIPVWLLRDLSEFSPNVRIKSLAPLQETTKSVVVQPFPGISRSLFVGPSDSCLKLDAIYKYSRQHFSADESGLAPQSPFGPVDVSISERPAKRAKIQTAPSVSRSRPLPAPNDKDIAKFHPTDHPFWPAILPAWRDALAAVDHSNSRVVAEWTPGDSGYRFPDPHLFVPPTTSMVNKRISSYFITWLNYEDAIRLAQCSPTSSSHTTTRWRELLLLSMKEAGLLSFKANSGAEGRMSEMTTLLHQWIAKHHIKMAIPDAASAKVHGYTLTFDSLPPADIACMVVYVLCELNFRSELRALDAYMHIPHESHRKAAERDTLLGYCFPGWLPGVAGGDVLTVSADDGSTGLCAPIFEDRRRYVLALAQLMSSWRGAPPTIRTRVPGQSATSISFVDPDLERTCAVFYSQSFFDRFARVPTVPRYLGSRLLRQQ
ncbi:hypothetical protein PC9H_010217 [Pleurotus ostreatus]|uniref:Uncharacterized protein n=1 Tax=Pleurotus ostreatus TaxID=5322 RepID=A0A8H6ZS55_PLEOS|nr:uncharacterized protein PC9H_010217 [Pleurotus ostreatus]KAF7424906.1 hypothetical protein PC9H_010217 [Pleurotus ostreatus]